MSDKHEQQQPEADTNEQTSEGKSRRDFLRAAVGGSTAVVAGAAVLVSAPTPAQAMQGPSNPPTQEQRTFAWLVNDQIGLPRGLAKRLLEEHGVAPLKIAQITSVLVPYGHEEVSA